MDRIIEENDSMDQIALAKLKDAEPEEFYLVTVDMDSAVVTKIETGLDEKKVREHFVKQHLPEVFFSS